MKVRRRLFYTRTLSRCLAIPNLPAMIDERERRILLVLVPPSELAHPGLELLLSHLLVVELFKVGHVSTDGFVGEHPH